MSKDPYWCAGSGEPLKKSQIFDSNTAAYCPVCTRYYVAAPGTPTPKHKPVRGVRREKPPTTAG